MKQCPLLLLFFFLLFSKNAFAQQLEFVFKNFTQEEGLPSNETYFIFEDSRHYLWIATDLGVARYNGNKFELFNLPDNVVFKIKEDNKGRIWFFTQKAKLAYFEHEKMYPYKYNDSIANHIKNIHIIDSYIDKEDNVILNSTFDSNFAISNTGRVQSINYGRFDKQGNNKQKYKYGSYIKEKLAPEFDTACYQIKLIDKKFFFAQKIRWNWTVSHILNINLTNGITNNRYNIPFIEKATTHYGCATINGKDVYLFIDKIIYLLKQDGSYLTAEMPNPILCLNKMNGSVWVGMLKSGAVLLNPDLTLHYKDTVLANKSISSITTDFEGGVWFSTLENGLYYIKNIEITHFKTNNFLNPQVFRIFNKDNKYLLFGTTNGLHKLKNGLESTLLTEENFNIGDLFSDSNGNVFLSGNISSKTGGLGEMRRLKDPDVKNVYLIGGPNEMGKLHDTLILDRSFHLDIFNKSKKNIATPKAYSEAIKNTFMKSITATPSKLFTDKSGTVWVGSSDGLFKINSTWTDLESFKPSSAILKKGISCIRQMDNGNIVAGIRFSGVSILQDTNILATITEKEGLLSNKVKYFLPLKNQLWVATARGISVISFLSYQPFKYKITNIGKNEGLYNVTINQLTAYQDKIVAATSNGMYFIETPAAFLEKGFSLLPFSINAINYYKGDTTGINSISLPYTKNRLLIKYSAVSFNSYEEIRYLYRFEKTDTNWHSTSSSELLMENLQPGIYKLQIKAVIPKQNRFSAIEEFTIEVQKPWWQNNWFRLLVIFSIAAGIYAFIKSRITKVKNEEQHKTELNTKIAELEQTALRSQMNPHFIFNCLTSIQQLIVSGNKTDANEYLVKFARLIRKTLELSSTPFITIREEIEYLNEYLFLEQLRLSGQFEFKINTGNDVNRDKIQIPNMMIQPVVENCIRHGIKPLENSKGIILITFEKTQEFITCTVTDNGIGRINSNEFNRNSFTEHKSYGIDIIRKRLKAIKDFNKQDIGIEIRDMYNADASASGTQVIIQLPYKKIQ